MTGSAPSHKSRSEEPHCYNCGASGHWVIACPEPTRETPAGLSAWRKSSNAGHGRGKDHHGGPKKSKGPIITKYAPPPPPPSSVGGPGSYYPPPPTGYYPPPNPQPGSLPYPPPHYPPQPPPPSAGYHPPPYHNHAPAYPPQHFPPAPAYPPHPVAHPPYPASVPPRPPPPVSTLPSRHPQYPPSRPEVHSYASPPPHAPPHHPPGPHSSTYRQPRPSFSPPASRASASNPTPSKPKSLPPPPSLTQSIHHSLPPKPPKVVHESQDSSRGHRHKRKNDRQNRQRDNRTKEQHGSRPPDSAQNHGDNRNGRHVPRPLVDAPSSLPDKLGDGQAHSEAKPKSKSPSSCSPRDDAGKVSGKTPPGQPGDDSHAGESVSDDLDDWYWDFKAIFKEPEDSKKPDEVGSPLPHVYTDDVLLPRKWDAGCLVSKYVNPHNLDEYIRPIHETISWPTFEFDPAFIRNGQFPNGEPLADYSEKFASFDFQELATLGRARGLDDHHSPEATDRNSQSGTLNASDTSTHAETDVLDQQAKSSDQKAQSIQEDHDSDHPQSSPAIPRTRIRKRSRDRGRSPNASRDSRRSSVSSQSSDLSSLEAELLGRPSKRKRSSNIPRRRRVDSHSRQQPGRWPSVASSAYSRRW